MFCSPILFHFITEFQEQVYLDFTFEASPSVDNCWVHNKLYRSKKDKPQGTWTIRQSHSVEAGLPEEVFLEESNTLGDDWWTVQKEYHQESRTGWSNNFTH